MPSDEALEASARRHVACAGRRIEHVIVRHTSNDTNLVAFAMVHDPADAREVALRVGAAIAAQFAHVRFCGFRVWRDEHL